MKSSYWSEHESFLAQEFPNPPKLIKPILAWGGVGLLHGPPGHGKTLFALSLAQTVARKGWLLHEFQCKYDASVLFIQLDMPDVSYQEYWRSAEDHTGDIRHLTTNGNAIDVMDSKRVPDMLKYAAEGEPTLVIVDSLRKSHTMDENLSHVPTIIYAAWRQLFPGSTFVFLHHDRKESTNAMFGKNKEDAGRGSVAWPAEADLGMQFQRTSPNGKPWAATLTCSKIRGPGFLPIQLKLDTDTLMIEPTNLSAHQRARRFLTNHPSASQAELAGSLMDDMKLARSRAYEVAQEVIQYANAVF